MLEKEGYAEGIGQVCLMLGGKGRFGVVWRGLGCCADGRAFGVKMEIFGDGGKWGFGGSGGRGT